MHLKSTLLALALLFTAVCATASTGLVGSGYLETGVTATDLRSPITVQSVDSVFATANVPVASFLDIGGTASDSRIAAKKLDFTKLNVGVPITVHTDLFGGLIVPYVRGDAGWEFDRYSTHHFSAFDYQAGPGVEINPFSAVSVGFDVLYDVTTKAAAGKGQRVYDPYVTVWLGKHLGVTAAYEYSAPANSATYSLGTVLRF